MSLTSFLELKEIKDKFREEFKKPIIKAEKELLAPPLTQNFGLVGTAFDYLLRFIIEYYNSNVQTSAWVAENVPIKLEGYKNLQNYVSKLIRFAHKQYDEYQQSGEIKEELLQSCLYLAQIDVIHRIGKIDENLGIIDEKDLEDLRNLADIVPLEQFKVKKYCVLNPTFGEGSILVGRADADIIMDGMLIDIKTTKKPAFTRKYFNQLIGYYILNKIGGIDQIKEEVEIKELVIYYSRHGELVKLPVEEVFKDVNIEEFIGWFTEKAKHYFPES